MATSVTPVSVSPSPAQDAAPQNPGMTQVADQQTFLQLLVAQIKNQNPLDPTDATQFVSQLAQFSELEQMIGMRGELHALRQDVETAPQQPGGATPPNNPPQV